MSAQPARITVGRRDTNVSPDVWAVRLDEMRALDWDRMTGLLLAIEVLGPSTRREDRWHPDGAREPFTIALAELFAPL